MYPILFDVGSITVYSYGFMIAIGIVAGMAYLIIQGKKEVGLTFDQGNSLFLFIFFAAFAGGKLFLFFEDPAGYLASPKKLITGRGFVFYGSFLLAIPTMWWFFRRHKLHPYKMLDVMAITTCLVHMFGRIGCFLAVVVMANQLILHGVSPSRMPFVMQNPCIHRCIQRSYWKRFIFSSS